ERLPGFVLALDEAERAGGDLVVDRLHALLGERAGVLDLPAGEGVDHAPRTEPLLELRIFRVVDVLRLLLGVQVIGIAEELIEAVGRRQELVAVAEVVLAELAGRVAQRFQKFGDGRILRAQADVGAREADLRETGADRRLARDERGPSGGTALLPVPVGEHRAFSGDASGRVSSPSLGHGLHKLLDTLGKLLAVYVAMMRTL